MGASLDRSIGALLGLACGDAVGTTLEFRTPGTFEPISDMVGGGPFGLPAGAWTDDTSMALCLAESLIDRGGHDPHDQMRRYLLWHDEGYLSSTGTCFDIGITTRSQLERFRRTGEPHEATPDQESAANGSLMRLAPVPIRWHPDPAEAADRAAASSRTTHGADRPVDACRVAGGAVAALIAGAAWDEVVDQTVAALRPLHPEVDAVVAGSWRAKEPPAIRGSGYCVAALEAALWAVGGASSYRDAVLRAANLGDDADTTAAIAGQLAGARWGAQAIPERWKELVVSKDRIVSLATSLHHAGVGEPSPVWPHDDFVHGWWVEDGLLAGEYPGHDDPARARDKVNVLVDAGVRTFVDLTTEHDPLSPYRDLVADAARTRGLDLRHKRFPIPDFSVVDDHRYDEVLAMIDEARSRGTVYLHCWGGVGRTGTVVGCLLARQGLGYDAVVSRLGELRQATRKRDRECPEVPAQHDLLRRRTSAGG